jgi:nickel-dependent lactate racemase
MNPAFGMPKSPMPFPASSIESPLVKSLHPIHEIVARLSQVDGNCVRLTRGSVTDGDLPELAIVEEVVSQADPAEATVAALAEPIEYPPLAAGIVPGDRVTIALDETTPCAAAVVRGAIRSFERAGVESEAITVVASDVGAIDICRKACEAEQVSGVKFAVHNPEDEKNLCMVGMTKGGVPLVVNREIFDADVVLPIGCVRVDGRGAYESLFPRFSNTEAIDRYRTPTFVESAAEQAQRKRETNQAGWLIGVPMVVEVVPGSGESVAHVLAGEPTAVVQESQELARERWSLESPQQVSLMIATIGGGPEAQNWTSVGRALAMAEKLVADGGAVAICSNLSEPPGPSLGRLIGNPDWDKVERKISHEHEVDSWPAWQLARALQRGPVYFLSQLDEETVEDLGLAPVASIDEIVRLAERQESFVVVEDSQNAVVTLADSGDES